METNHTIDITAASDIDLMELLYADTIATKAGRRAAVYAMDLDPSIALLDWIDGGAEDAVESFLMAAPSRRTRDYEGAILDAADARDGDYL